MQCNMILKRLKEFQYNETNLETCFEYHISYGSEDLSQKIVGVDSANDCQRFCQEEKPYNHYSHIMETGDCKLKIV